MGSDPQTLGPGAGGGGAPGSGFQGSQIANHRVLECIASVLHEDGTFLMQDIRASSHVHKNLDHPAAPLFYTYMARKSQTVSGKPAPTSRTSQSESRAGVLLGDARRRRENGVS